MNKSYSLSDLLDHHGLPLTEVTRNDFGTIKAIFVFDELVRTEYDRFGDIHYCYSDTPCEGMILIQDLDDVSQFQIRKIDDAIISELEQEGYTRHYNQDNDFVGFVKDDVRLSYDLDASGLRMFVHVGPIQNNTSLSPENRQPSHSGVSRFVVIDGSQLRLRLGPSTSADTFKWPDGTNRHPNVGDRFRYLGESGDFYKIGFNGNELWVSKQYSHLE